MGGFWVQTRVVVFGQKQLNIERRFICWLEQIGSDWHTIGSLQLSRIVKKPIYVIVAVETIGKSLQLITLIESGKEKVFVCKQVFHLNQTGTKQFSVGTMTSQWISPMPISKKSSFSAIGIANCLDIKSKTLQTGSCSFFSLGTGKKISYPYRDGDTILSYRYVDGRLFRNARNANAQYDGMETIEMFEKGRWNWVRNEILVATDPERKWVGVYEPKTETLIVGPVSDVLFYRAKPGT